MMIAAFDYVDFFFEVVDNSRLRGLITSIVEQSDGVYLCSVSDADGVVVGKYIDLGVDGLRCSKIISIPSEGQMIIKDTVGANISNVEKYVRLDPFVYADRRLKTIEALLSKNNIYFADKKFPSIELVLDYNKFDDKENYSNWDSMKVIFCDSSDPKDTASAKDDLTFKPTIRPNYIRFMQSLRSANGAMCDDLKVTRTEYFNQIYKSEGGHNKPFYVDALVADISNLKLLANYDNCVKDF